MGLDEPELETLEEALRNAIRADRLVNDPDFQWWRHKYLDVEVVRAGEKLDAAVDNANYSNLCRGIRKGLRKALRGLDFMASRKAELEELVNARRQDSK